MSNLSVFFLCARTRLEVEQHITFLACVPTDFHEIKIGGFARAGKWQWKMVSNKFASSSSEFNYVTVSQLVKDISTNVVNWYLQVSTNLTR